jgi:formate hydrogenlyase subunit 3/multisubunit Na+/H+ antiporter MnhD subunit
VTNPEAVFPALGLLLFGLAWPLAFRRVPPNRWYGLRVPATFADERVWYEANARTGRDMMALGGIVVLVGLFLPLVVPLRREAYVGICAAILGLGSMILTTRGWRAANRMLRELRDTGAQSPKQITNR